MWSVRYTHTLCERDTTQRQNQMHFSIWNGSTDRYKNNTHATPNKPNAIYREPEIDSKKLSERVAKWHI